LILKCMVNDAVSVENTFRALADPTRRAIVSQLSRGAAPVSALVKPLGITLAAVVQHVQTLEECGVIRTEKRGRVRTCRVRPESLTVVEQWLASRRSQWESHLDRLGAVLEARANAAKRGAP
jgi:DNA-binding transcriptional ArsR family regulator